MEKTIYEVAIIDIILPFQFTSPLEFTIPPGTFVNVFVSYFKNTKAILNRRNANIQSFNKG